MEYACTQCTHAHTQRHRAHKPGIGPPLLPNSEFRVATTQIPPVPSNVQLPEVESVVELNYFSTGVQAVPGLGYQIRCNILCILLDVHFHNDKYDAE